MVVEAALVEDLRDRDDRAGLRIGRCEDHEGYAREHDRARAHDTRLERHVDRAVDEAPGAKPLPRLAEREQLGMPGRIVLGFATVSSTRDDVAAADDDRSDGHIVV